MAGSERLTDRYPISLDLPSDAVAIEVATKLANQLERTVRVTGDNGATIAVIRPSPPRPQLVH